MEEGVTNFFREFGEWQLRICIEMLGDCQQGALQVCGAGPIHGSHEAKFVGSNICVGNEFGGINFQNRAQSVTALASAVGRVERKGTWLQRRNVDTANDTSHAF